ncbi:3285_t:CDS:2 [Gigaspora margarita]|uniref:3285_t:CDS:1 n=1 Tax=Gigaspora margarita TaxID=4874 RepID=A0ABN7UVQ7_GIGMA|nr:3285_t:CDS:2 [Gigaspora margarita]
MQRKKQKNAKHKVTKAAHCENYNINDVTLLNIGQINVLCPECKALHWIGYSTTSTCHFLTSTIANTFNE